MSAADGLARRMGRMQRSTIREILKLTKRPEVISFAGGLPAPELFPVREFQAALDAALSEDGASALQYDVTEGYRPLKELLCAWLTRRGLPCRPEAMMLTSGSQQALDLIGKIFLNPGDHAVVENPTYLGAIQSFNAYEARYRPVPMDEEGVQHAPLEQALRASRSRFFYTVPTFQNPSGISMSLARRQAVVRAARRAHRWIIEDDPYSYLRFRGEELPSLYALAKGRKVVYLSTFSKILSPGIRLGFVLAEPRIIEALILAKQAADLQPNSLIQRAVYRYADAGHLDAHIPAIISSYKARAEAMTRAARRYFPPGVRLIPSDGGMFQWCVLPQGLDAGRIFKQAVRENVAYVTGAVFHAAGGGENTCRLNFTNASAGRIEEGMRRLGQVFSKAVAQA